jgi:ABC-type nickel/cobalt efflux system permease component RcnA
MKKSNLFRSFSLVLAAFLFFLGMSLSACGDSTTVEEAADEVIEEVEQKMDEHPADHDHEHPGNDAQEHPGGGSEHPTE